MSEADEKVAALVAKKARENAEDWHLRECPDLIVSHPEAEDDYYGCETGCEYARLRADLSCPHGNRERFEYGVFGDIAWMIEAMQGA